MRSVKLAATTLVIAALPLGSAMADTFWRNDNPDLQASDMELASAILAGGEQSAVQQ